MRTKILLIMLFSALVFAGCRKSFEKVEDVNFDVSVSSEVFKVGEKVVFNMEGSPDFITFWSGEVGSEYAYRNTDRIVETQMSLSFSTTTTAGTKGTPNPAGVLVEWSSDFSGEYTEEALSAATWHDITREFNLPSDTGVSNLFSGELLVSPFFTDPKKPIYFRFYYKVDAFDETAADGKGNGRTQWLFYSVSFKGITGETFGELYDIISGGWKIVCAPSFDGQASFPDINASRILFRSDFRPTHDLECWAVSGPIYRMDYINNGPDHGVGIKAMADADRTQYSYSWDEPGEYTVTLVAANSNIYERKETVKEFKIRIVEDDGVIIPPSPSDWK